MLVFVTPLAVGFLIGVWPHRVVHYSDAIITAGEYTYPLQSAFGLSRDAFVESRGHSMSHLRGGLPYCLTNANPSLLVAVGNKKYTAVIYILDLATSKLSKIEVDSAFGHDIGNGSDLIESADSNTLVLRRRRYRQECLLYIDRVHGKLLKVEELEPRP